MKTVEIFYKWAMIKIRLPIEQTICYIPQSLNEKEKTFGTLFKILKNCQRLMPTQNPNKKYSNRA